MSDPSSYLTPTPAASQLFGAKAKRSREALKVDDDDSSCVSCGSPAKKRPVKHDNVPLCGSTGHFCAGVPFDCKVPLLPLSYTMLRVTFTGERQLKWRVRRMRKDGVPYKGKSDMKLVDCVTGRTFKMPHNVKQ